MRHFNPTMTVFTVTAPLAPNMDGAAAITAQISGAAPPLVGTHHRGARDRSAITSRFRGI